MAKSQGAFYEELGKRIRTAREAAKLTQEQLAGALNLTRTSVTNIERGRQPVMAHVLVQMATTLNTTIQKLVPPRETVEPTGRINSRLKKLDEPKREWVTRIIASGAHPSAKE